ncbi:MAG: aldehyde dehydrogenase family protein [Planctomycetes bacterium]|nr:aldehyde dehydrogenase family protein [Planctomycetota bacterium]
MQTHPLILAGTETTTGSTFQHRSAIDQQDLGAVCLAGKNEVNSAISAAMQARAPMARLSAGARESALRRTAEAIMDRQEEFAQLITAETAKPISLARGEVARAVNTFEIAAEEAKRIAGEVISLDTLQSSERRFGIVRRFPRGVVIGISPFNFPINLVAHKVAPALAAGCPIILKPPPQAPLTSLLLGRILRDLKLPAGAFSVMPCANDIAELLVRDDRPAVLSFTGSAKVGWHLKSICGRKRSVLELGGNAAVIVEADADLDVAAQRIVTGAFAHAGQVCIKVQRVFAHENIADRLLARLIEITNTLGMGDPRHQDVLVGPLIDEANAQRVAAWVSEAVKAGANIVAGGTREGQFYRPTWLTDVPEDAKASCEEMFGPVATFARYQDFEAALHAVNATEYGLQAGVFTQSLPKMLQAFETLEVGGVIVNDVPTYRVDQMPYGGVKGSGLGREGPKYAIEAFTEPRLLAIKP